MDGYADEQSYVLHKLFSMPDGTKAVAFSQKTGNHITALYSILVIAIFAAFWSLLVKIAFMLPYRTSDMTEGLMEQQNNDYRVMHRVLSSSPADGITSWLMYPIARIRYHGDPKNGRSPDLFIAVFSAIFMFLATALYLGGKVAGIFLPAVLSIGNVAPVNTSTNCLFSPLSEYSYVLQSFTYASVNKNCGILAISMSRAFGHVDDA
ncbi:hypothetical protein RUND412_006094 [Rhizina undulata]